MDSPRRGRRATGRRRDERPTRACSAKRRLVFWQSSENAERERPCRTADVLLSWGLEGEASGEVLTRAKRLRLLQLISAGVDHLDFGWHTRAGRRREQRRRVCEAMAEHVMAMVLACAKRLPQRQAGLARGSSTSDPSRSLWTGPCARSSVTEGSARRRGD